MYIPPPTNALNVNPYTGATTPITSVGELLLFSSPADLGALLPLIQQMAPNAVAGDGNGTFGPPVLYGSDGRTINIITGTVELSPGSQPIACTLVVGLVIAQKFYGPMWNGMNQPQPGPGTGGGYNALKFASDGAGGVQVEWWYNPAGPSTLPPAQQTGTGKSPIIQGPPIG
jgi:hypothetical protein